MKRIIHFLDKNLEEILVSFFLSYFVFACVVQVIMRFIFHSPPPWTEETARYSFIWMVFTGTALATKRKANIRINILEVAFKNPKAKAFMTLFADIMFLIFSAIATFLGIQVCINCMSNVQTTPVMQWPFVYIYASLPVGFGLTTIRLVQQLVRRFLDNRELKEGTRA